MISFVQRHQTLETFSFRCLPIKLVDVVPLASRCYILSVDVGVEPRARSIKRHAQVVTIKYRRPGLPHALRYADAPHERRLRDALFGLRGERPSSRHRADAVAGTTSRRWRGPAVFDSRTAPCDDAGVAPAHPSEVGVRLRRVPFQARRRPLGPVPKLSFGRLYLFTAQHVAEDDDAMLIHQFRATLSVSNGTDGQLLHARLPSHSTSCQGVDALPGHARGPSSI